MRRFHWLVLLALSIFLGSAAIAQQPAAPQTAAAAPAFSPVASILELMQEIVDPTADFIFESVSVIVTKEGEKETRPRTDEEWLAIRHQALILAESGNLLKMRGRTVAPAKPIRGIEFEPPGPDDLPPARVQELLKKNPVPFENFAQKLTEAALIAVRAVDARSVDGLYEAGDAIDEACENCHLVYWYPGSPSTRKPIEPR
jgi:hypothetical protein